MHTIERRVVLQRLLAAACIVPARLSAQPAPPPLRITGLRVTPVALPDPPILAAGGCHGPYFLRTIVQMECEGNIVGIGETRGGQRIADEFEKARPHILGQSAFAYRALARTLRAFSPGPFAVVELA